MRKKKHFSREKKTVLTRKKKFHERQKRFSQEKKIHRENKTKYFPRGKKQITARYQGTCKIHSV